MLPVIAITLAREGSKRLKGKNLRFLCGKPMISYTIESAVKAVGNCYVSTDSTEIAAVGETCGGKPLIRPPHLAEDTSSAIEVLHHVFTQQIQVPDAVVAFLNCTSPLRTAEDIEGALKLFHSCASPTLLSAFRNNKFFWEKADSDTGVRGFYHPRNYSPSARPRSQDMPPVFQENGAIYISTIRYILDHGGNWLDSRSMIYEMPEYRSFEVDTIEDLELCESILQSKKERHSNEENPIPCGRTAW